VLVPLIGIAGYVLLVKKMLKEEIPEPPMDGYFLLFGIYGVLFVLMLTAFFWYYSGMAFLGGLAAIVIGPIISGVLAYRSYRQKGLSLYHFYLHWLSIVYLFILAMFFLLAIMLSPV
jgi:hypothetical protein